MRNLRLEIEYDGTNYCGWQVQTCSRLKPSIQETLEKTLQKILQEKVRLIGSGRTDAGVHAQAQVANFKTNSAIKLEKLQLALNSLLPDDIVVRSIEEVGINFHSRFSAQAKVYRYSILNRRYPSAIQRQSVYFCSFPLNLRHMQQQARFLLGRHDFKSFQAVDKTEKNSLRTIRQVKVSKRGDFIYIDIEADGFLYNMVRNIVGTLVEIGRGKPISMQKLIALKDRTQAGPTAPAKGLSLLKVHY